LAVLLLATFCAAGSGSASPVTAPADPVPLIHAHAHNDYEHPHPLTDALECGFCSVEADIHLVDGKLLVAHDRIRARPDRTLQSLYLEPLRQRAKANGGSVYRDGPPVWLLIDIKGDGPAVYGVLRDVLKEYADLLTVFRQGADGKPEKPEQHAVTAVLTGNRPADLVAAEKVRYCAIDGHLDDLDAKPSAPADLIPWVSAQWGRSFTWKGVGPLPEEQRQKLMSFVDKAHAQGRLIRFWAAPDSRAAWAELRGAGVDLLNTDDQPF
jgi:hypothetical protein